MDDNDESVGRAASNETDSIQGEAGSSNRENYWLFINKKKEKAFYLNYIIIFNI